MIAGEEHRKNACSPPAIPIGVFYILRLDNQTESASLHLCSTGSFQEIAPKHHADAGMRIVMKRAFPVRDIQVIYKMIGDH